MRESPPAWDEGAVLNEAAHSGLLYAASELATAALALPPRRHRRHLDPAIVRRRRWRAPAACGALLIVVGLSPWQTTGPALNPTVAILWVRQHTTPLIEIKRISLLRVMHTCTREYSSASARTHKSTA